MYLYVFMILLWHYWNCTASTKKKHKKKNEKWGKRGWTLRVVLSKNGGMFREIVRFFMGKKKMVTYPLVIHCILWSLRIRLFTRICMRHKLITIMTERTKDYLLNVFPVISFWLFIVIIDIRNGYVENCETKLHLVQDIMLTNV